MNVMHSPTVSPPMNIVHDPLYAPGVTVSETNDHQRVEDGFWDYLLSSQAATCPNGAEIGGIYPIDRPNGPEIGGIYPIDPLFVTSPLQVCDYGLQILCWVETMIQQAKRSIEEQRAMLTPFPEGKSFEAFHDSSRVYPRLSVPGIGNPLDPIVGLDTHRSHQASEQSWYPSQPLAALI
ncbi:hypothetical protein HGRIS_001127 [Hohenbuehelia grisea]|uniref:Uncharacterized protein n=1 Tax=Hohenbuehelia grisea TaxID=104357 RepID=A0ABR3JND0_9AGAR